MKAIACTSEQKFEHRGQRIENVCDVRLTAAMSLSIPQRALFSWLEKHSILQEFKKRSVQGSIEKVKEAVE